MKLNKLKNKNLFLSVCLSLSCALTGCSTLHTDYERPELTSFTFRYGHLSQMAKNVHKPYTKELKVKTDRTQNVKEAKDVTDNLTQDLWLKFKDPMLNTLILEALERNADYLTALNNVKKAMVAADITDTNLIPTINADLRSSISKDLSKSSSSNKSSSSSIGLSYEVDLFGKLSAQRKQSSLEFKATEFDALTARMTLISTVAKIYWDIIYYQDAIDLSIQNINHSKETLIIMQERYASGDVSELELIESKRDLLNMQETLAENETLLKNNLTAMNILLLKVPDEKLTLNTSLKDLTLPSIKHGLKADILQHRPDLAAAEYSLKASLANVDVKRLSMYPSFTLTANLSAGEADEIANFFKDPVGSVAGMLSFPFLNYYQRQLDIDLASLDKDGQEIQFVKLYYQALGEVDDALKEIELYNLKLQNSQRTLILNKKREDIYLTQYKAGKVPLKDYLQAQTERRNSEMELLKFKNVQLNNIMTFGKSVGVL